MKLRSNAVSNVKPSLNCVTYVLNTVIPSLEYCNEIESEQCCSLNSVTGHSMFVQFCNSICETD